MTLRALLVVLVGGAAQTPQPTPLDAGCVERTFSERLVSTTADYVRSVFGIDV
jgi:hypothetical protein